ncbi:hypothetical protein SAMD00019534_097210 [Acytostelium subglobosum LB1]|uniref:hypothetical protein n=1 Tax=Acytostelium subglobosum LB1 TaxID=1410327 RepID=UPI000644E917|nr:hypothetical protein SAMD00019534_097210 [Acytostelium subglobosum LB1]GAM26546.1 hypothetical protein SAMD00019534_097210 [Acytostelium subglobosum LB1]|eukprot:XP_012750642.1 hypothetical protein SAMD00019534_097210 [Acytostelium subglobosum LB1]
MINWHFVTQSYSNIAKVCTRPVPVFHLLKYRHIHKHLFNGRQNMPTKIQLLENVQRDDVFEHQQQLYKQFKRISPARAYLDATRIGHTKEQSGPTDEYVPMIALPSLSTLIIKHIVTFLVFDRAWDSKWIVTLSTVSSQFHQAVSSVLTNNVIPTLSIRSMITHLGSPSSKHCLFKSPPLHLNAVDLEHIPSDQLDTCLDRLESLQVPICLLTYSRIVLVKVRAPNVKHIKFEDRNETMDRNTQSRESALLHDLQHWHKFGVQVSMNSVNRDSDKQCTYQFFTQLFQFYLNDNNNNNNNSSSVQSIEIVSRSPVGPPSLPEHYKGRFNFTWDLETSSERVDSEEWVYDRYSLNDEYDDNFHREIVVVHVQQYTRVTMAIILPQPTTKRSSPGTSRLRTRSPSIPW